MNIRHYTVHPLTVASCENTHLMSVINTILACTTRPASPYLVVESN